MKRRRDLRARPGVRKLAVQNFIASMKHKTREQALAELVRDAKRFDWNADTIAIARASILAYFRALGGRR